MARSAFGDGEKPNQWPAMRGLRNFVGYQDNKQAAEDAGEKTYIGAPCKKGHQLRYTNGNHCVECRRVYDKNKNTVARLARKSPQNYCNQVFILGNPDRLRG